MNPEDPEERIRQLERSAGAVELGARPYPENEGTRPTAPLAPPTHSNQPPGYGDASMYGDSYQPQPRTHHRPAQGKGIPGELVLGIAAVFVVIVLCGVGVIVWNVLSSV